MYTRVIQLFQIKHGAISEFVSGNEASFMKSILHLVAKLKLTNDLKILRKH